MTSAANGVVVVSQVENALHFSSEEDDLNQYGGDLCNLTGCCLSETNAEWKAS